MTATATKTTAVKPTSKPKPSTRAKATAQLAEKPSANGEHGAIAGNLKLAKAEGVRLNARDAGHWRPRSTPLRARPTDRHG